MATVEKVQAEAPESQPVVSSWREDIPACGLREYWYPAILARKVGRRKPVGVRLLGENVVFFRDRDGKIVALQDLCAHRGTRLSGGVCHFPGTVSCPYHGWTYDAQGKCVAVLVEGPDSHVPQTSARVQVKHVRELRGIVWVWIGDGQPVPLEEDIPEEFLNPDYLILTDTRLWRVNWRLLIENAIDGHAPYVHRNSLLMVLYGMPPLGQRLRPIATRDGKGVALLKETWPPMQQDYAGLGRFPKRLWRRYWARILAGGTRRENFSGKPYTQEIVLPGITRIDYGTHFYVRWGVPVDETRVRNFYWHVFRGSALSRWWSGFCYHVFRRWAMTWNFSEQDRAIVGSQDYRASEKLSWTDAVIIQWRKMVLQGYHVERLRRVRRGVAAG